MLATDIIMNFIPSSGTGALAPVLGFIGGLIVAGIAGVGLWLSDLRKIEQEDRRRWDEELVSTVIDMLVLTDDVASTEKALRKKKKAILAGDLPQELNRHLVYIRLLSNQTLADQAQHVVTHYFSERILMHKFLSKEVSEGKKLDEITEVPGYSFGSTTSEAYHDARRYFLNLFHQLLVSVSVQKFTAESSVDWKKMVNLVNEVEKEMKKKEEEPKHRRQDEAIPATPVREWIA
jgi:gluconate kinase